MAFLYSRYSDNVAPNATPSVDTGTEDTAYPAANLVDRDPGKPAKLTTTTGSYLWDFGSAQRVDLFGLIHHNLTAGLDVKIQANATNAWGSPTVSAAVTIPALPGDGYNVNPFVDLTGVAGYSSGGFRYWRLLINTANANPVAIGEVWLGTTKRTMAWVLYGIEFVDAFPMIEHRTDFLVSHVYSFGVRNRRVTGLVRMTNDIRDDLVAWGRDNRGRARGSLIVPDSTKNDCLMARFASSDVPWVRTLPNLNETTLAFEEIARGLYL